MARYRPAYEALTRIQADMRIAIIAAGREGQLELLVRLCELSKAIDTLKRPPILSKRIDPEVHRIFIRVMPRFQRSSPAKVLAFATEQVRLGKTIADFPLLPHERVNQ